MKTLPLFLILFLLTACQNPFTPQKATLVIGIQPYEQFPIASIDSIQESLKEVYQAKVVVLPTIELPTTAFTTLRFPRYRADSLLRHLRAICPDSIDYILGLTTKDISTTKYAKDGGIKYPAKRYRDWGIFGLGFCPGKSCVVSNHRLKHNNAATYFSRIQKICVHEIGHNLGLPHCTQDPKCVLQDAVETIKTIDNADLWLCPKCQAKIAAQ